MKKESKLLLKKAIDSLILSVEHFNRPFEVGRCAAVLILLDHSFEMLLKAAIVNRGGKIREKRAAQTIGFDTCVRRALSDGKIKFLEDEQALSLQIINSLRDAAQHHLVEVSEDQLYIHAQSGLTLFRDLLTDVFKLKLADYMPERVLPISITPPSDLASLFDKEVREVQKLLSPKSRKKTEAAAKIKALAIVDAAVQGQTLQPSTTDLNNLMKKASLAESWTELFPGVAQLNITAEGVGPSIDLRLTKKEGVPVQLVPEGTPGATVIAIKKVDNLGFYSLGRDQLAEKIGLSGPKTTAIIRFARLKEDQECYKLLTIGKSKFERYSPKAIEKIQSALKSKSSEEIWKSHGIKWKSPKK